MRDAEFAARLDALIKRRGGRIMSIDGGQVIFLPTSDGAAPRRLRTGRPPGQGKAQTLTAAEFARWMDRRRLRPVEAAKLLNERIPGARYTSSMVGRWASGNRRVPLLVADEVRQMQDEERAKKRPAGSDGEA